MILFGIIEFGFVFSNDIGFRSGASATARDGAISLGSFNNAPPSCNLVGVSGASNDVEDLMCYGQSEVGLSGVRFKVLFDNASLTSSGASYAVGNALVVCAIYPLSSVTGVFKPLLDGRYLRTRDAYRIEQAPSDGQIEVAGAETDPSGGGWSWCQS